MRFRYYGFNVPDSKMYICPLNENCDGYKKVVMKFDDSKTLCSVGMKVSKTFKRHKSLAGLRFKYCEDSEDPFAKEPLYSWVKLADEDTHEWIDKPIP